MNELSTERPANASGEFNAGGNPRPVAQDFERLAPLQSVQNALRKFGWPRFATTALALMFYAFWFAATGLLNDPEQFDLVIDESLRIAVNDPHSPLIIADLQNPNAGITVHYPDFPINFVQVRVDANPGSSLQIEDSAATEPFTARSEEQQTRLLEQNTQPTQQAHKLTIRAAADNHIRRVEVIFGVRPNGKLHRPQALVALGGVTILLSFFLLLTSREIQQNRNRTLNIYILFTALIIFTGLVLRSIQAENAYYQELGYDATGYVEIAKLGGGLYETAMSKPPWVREPLWPWILRAWFLIFPGTNASAMHCSLFVSVAAMGLAAVVGRRVFGDFPGLIGVAALAITPEWIGMSARVLRHDLVLLLILLGLGLKTWKTLERAPYFRSSAWGLWGAAIMLTQFSFLLFVFPMLAWEAVRTRWKPTEYALAAGILALLITPHLMFNARFQDSGDPLFSSSIHTLYYFNKENIGKPGFPSALEFRENPYVGEPMSTAEFFFKHHTFLEVVKIHLKGYWNLFVWVQPRIYLFRGVEWLMLPGLLGGIELLRRRKEWAALVFAFAVLPFAFIAGLGADLRLGMEATVFVAWVWGIGIVAMTNGALWLIKQREAKK